MIKQLRSISFLAITFSFVLLTWANQSQACTGYDVIINKITITSLSGNDCSYTYEIKNTGTVAVSLSQLSIQNYISADNVYGAGDKAAGGAVLAASGTIPAGGTYTGTWGLYAGSGNSLSSYSYFFTKVTISGQTECDLNNNDYTGLIQLTTTGTQAAQLATANLYWNSEAKIFSVKDWSGNTTSSLQYTVFNMSGTLLLSGSTAEGQATPLASLQNGMYILYLTDGEKVYSKKIMY